LKKVGIYLPEPVFTHGQLYTAFSRSGDDENTKAFIENIENIQGRFATTSSRHIQETYTSNIVFPEALI